MRNQPFISPLACTIRFHEQKALFMDDNYITQVPVNYTFVRNEIFLLLISKNKNIQLEVKFKNH